MDRLYLKDEYFYKADILFLVNAPFFLCGGSFFTRYHSVSIEMAAYNACP